MKGLRRTALWVLVAVGAGVVMYMWRLQSSGPQTTGGSSGFEPVSAADVARGEYLARIGNCISCHTRPGGEPFAGGLAFSAPYSDVGTLYSTNITPDISTGIGSWTEAQFVRALREGEAPNHRPLFPAFPFTYFSRITLEDARALFAYLRGVKAVESVPPANTGIFTQRWGMRLWNALFFKKAEFEPDATRSADWNRGAYLVNVLGHCGACHTPRNFFLASKEDAALSGGTYLDAAGPHERRLWFAVNLTSAPEGLGAWSVQDLERYLKTGHSRRAGVFGPMNEVITNSLRYLDDADARAMAVYIKSLAPSDSESRETAAAVTQEGAAVYAEHCEECHLESGRGAFLKAPPLVGSAVVQGRHPATLINVILYGAQVAPGGPNVPGAWEDMPALGDKLTDEEVAAVGNYVRNSWNNKAGALTSQDVAKQR